MGPRAAGAIRFALLYLAIGLVFAGALGFIGFADKTHHYDYHTSRSEPPDGCCVVDYETLTPAQQRMVDLALSGEQLTFVYETAAPIPEEIVVKNGTYHVFAYYTTFDWLDYRTFVPAGLIAAGVGVAYGAIRWEHRRNPFA
ncbi:MAG: hypothetical protein ABEJ76_01480 [Halanaeroarchaeum sp.]